MNIYIQLKDKETGKISNKVKLEDTSRMEKETVWIGNNIIYTVIIEERF